MTRQNLDRLRQSIEAFGRSDEIEGFLAPDFELHQADSIIDTAGVFHGQTAPENALRELGQAFAELKFEAERFVEAPDGRIVVLVHARGRGRGSGVKIDNHIAWIWTFRGDQAVRLEIYEDQTDALEAVGLTDL